MNIFLSKNGVIFLFDDELFLKKILYKTITNHNIG